MLWTTILCYWSWENDFVKMYYDARSLPNKYRLIKYGLTNMLWTVILCYWSWENDFVKMHYEKLKALIKIRSLWWK